MNGIEINKNVIMSVCSLMIYCITLVLIVKGDYIIAIAAGILNISGIQLYRWVEDHE